MRPQKYKSNQESITELNRYTEELNAMLYGQLQSGLGFHHCPAHLQEKMQTFKM